MTANTVNGDTVNGTANGAGNERERVAGRLEELSSRRRSTEERETRSPLKFWMRWAHVYIGMFALLITLFFGVTGLTLNHPDWTFGDEVTTETFSGELPESVIVDGQIEFLAVSEFVRSTHGVGGEVSSFDTSGTEGTLSYKGPGYGAEVFFDTQSLDYSVTVQQQGFVAVMNDLHKGRDATSSWRWAIDVSAGLLVAISVTGLGIQLMMRKRRTRALILAGVGSVITIVLIWMAMA